MQELEPDNKTRNWPGVTYWTLITAVGAGLVFEAYRRPDLSGISQFVLALCGILFVVTGTNQVGRDLTRHYRDEKGRALPIGERSRKEWSKRNDDK